MEYYTANKPTVTTDDEQANYISKRGVVLIALGHPSYGRMAAMLAASIKTNGWHIITLLHDERGISHLIPEEMQLFTNMVKVPADVYCNSYGNFYTRAKVCLYDHSPYNETIFIDADTIACPHRSVRQLFEELAPYEMTMINEGHYNIDTGEDKSSDRYPYWFGVHEAMKAYNISSGRVYKTRSEFIYFKKTERVKRFFQVAKEVYDNPQVKHKKFAHGVADEMAFNIATGVVQLYPHEDNYKPIYWDTQQRNEYLKRGEIYANYYFYSIGGKMLSQSMERMYNDLSKYYQTKQGLKRHYQCRSKMKYLPERANI